jgi:hypothetical protein
LRNLTHKTLEGELSDEELSRLLVTTDLAECNSSGTEAMRLLHTTGGGLEDITKVENGKQTPK